MSADANEALLNALQDNISKLEKVKASKDELLAKKDSQLVALKKSGERKLEHIAHLELERIIPDLEDSDPAYDYHQLYRPARRTQIQKHQQDLIEADLAAAMASLTVADDELQLAKAKKHSCDQEILRLRLCQNKIEDNVEVLKRRQGQLMDTTEDLQHTVQQLNTAVAELQKQKAGLTVEIKNMNIQVQHNNYNFNAPPLSTSKDDQLSLSGSVAEVPASTPSVGRSFESPSTSTSVTSPPQKRFPPATVTSTPTKQLRILPTTPSNPRKNASPLQGSKPRVR